MAQNYRLKKGVLLQAFGDASKACTNDSPHFTDELAAWYLRTQPGVEKYFEVMPGKAASVNIPVPPRQGAPTIIIPPEKAFVPTVIVEPEKPVEELSAEKLITAVTEPKKRVTNKKK